MLLRRPCLLGDRVGGWLTPGRAGVCGYSSQSSRPLSDIPGPTEVGLRIIESCPARKYVMEEWNKVWSSVTSIRRAPKPCVHFGIVKLDKFKKITFWPCCMRLCFQLQLDAGYSDWLDEVEDDQAT